MAKKLTSRWKCRVTYKPYRGKALLLVKVYSDPIPDGDEKYGYIKEDGKRVSDVHPFAYFYDDQAEESAKGVYTEVVADNAITRAILETCSSKKRIDEASIIIEWTSYRATLLSLLNRLWV